MSGPLLSFDEDGGGGHRPVAEINVTPFVDVLLVLLIVFMVTAPMLAAGVKVDLPKAAGLPPLDETQQPLIVSIRADKSLHLGDQAISADDLKAQVRARVAATPDVTAHIRADASVPYQTVLETMAGLSEAGAAKIAFIGQATSAPATSAPAASPAQPGAAPAGAPAPSGAVPSP